MKIKDLCCDEQPREKMLAKGPSSLSNAELLAILFRTGDGKSNAVDLGRALLMQAGQSLAELSGWTAARLMEVQGIGTVKALSVCAAFELARRWFSENRSESRVRISDSQKAYEAIAPRLKSLNHEECWTILLNRAGELCSMEQISSGGLFQTTMDSREVVTKALEKHATGVILVHNHPSGSPLPGKNDIECTKRLKTALAAFDISLLDHIIVCDSAWYSFQDEEVHRL